jgi:AraC-like DNA-binding protein
MSDTPDVGVLYTEHSILTTRTPIASLWSYVSCQRDRGRRSVTLNPDGNHEYWLHRSDPLLNTILPGTHVTLIVNFGNPWAAGHSLATATMLPPVCVVGPTTQRRILRVGRSVCTVGAVLSPTLTSAVFGAPASELIDRIIPLQDLLSPGDVESFVASLSPLDTGRALSALRDGLMGRTCRSGTSDPVGHTAARLIKHHSGQVSIDDVARDHGLSHRQFARRFGAAAGMPPKLFARITRFQALLRALLSTDVSRWASVSTAAGFYDQAHMINEFRTFAGAPPTLFFQPHGVSVDAASIQIRGRPSEWLRA